MSEQTWAVTIAVYNEGQLVGVMPVLSFRQVEVPEPGVSHSGALNTVMVAMAFADISLWATLCMCLTAPARWAQAPKLTEG